MPEAASQPHRKTLTTISHNDLTLEFSRDRGEQRLTIAQPTKHALTCDDHQIIVLPLWAILEIRDYCAQYLPMPPGDYMR